MAEISLITITNVRSYRDISPSTDQTRFDTYVTDIQRNHLKKLLGSAMYYDLWQKVTDINTITSPYDDLVNGTDYEYANDTIQYYGLKPYLCYLYLSVFIIEGDTYHTDYGNGVFSDNPQDHLNRQPYRDRQAIRDYYINQANEYKCEVIKYLNENYSTYTLWAQTMQPADPRSMIKRQTIL